MKPSESAKNSCLLRINNTFPSLSKAEQKIANYILANPSNVVHMTITELAEAVQTAEASVSRLCKKLQFSGFQSLKIALATDIYEPFESLCNEVETTDSIESIAGKVFQNISDGLQDTLKIINPTAISAAIEAILSAQRIDVYGSGGSAVVAADFEHRFMRFGIPVHAYSDPHMQVAAASLLRPADVAVVFSHTGSSQDILQAVKIAKDSGATVIGVTSHLRSPLSKLSTIILHGMTREVNYRPEAMASRLIHLAIVDVLYVGAMLKEPELIAENMQKIRHAIAQRRV